MASSDVDQKYLGRIAQFIEDSNPDLSDALYQVLGLSVVLSRKLYRARKLRRLDTTRETRSLQLYHHIIWLSKEGLAILERYVLPYTQDGQEGPETQVLAAKLRASFLHIFCLFHNDPPITMASAPVVPSSHDPLFAGSSHEYSGSGYESMTPQKDNTPPKRNSRGKQPSLRDPINSITSDASFLTNPYAGLAPGSSPPLGYGTTTAPPGLSAVSVPHPSAFLIPSINFIPYANAYFAAASSSASAHLPGAHPLRLSTAIEYAAFMWDCVHDHQGARQLSRRAIRQLREGEDEGVSDEAFEDAAQMVQILGRIMKRKSFETTPRSQSDASAMPSAQAPAAPQFTSRETTRTPPEDEYARPAQRRRTSRTEEKPVTPPRGAWVRKRGDSTTSNSQQPTTPQYVREPQRTSLHDSGGPPSIEGGPVGGITATPPRRRESVKSTSASTHRRGQSVQISPALSGQRPSQRSSGSSRRRPVSDDYSPQQANQVSGPQRRTSRSSGGTQRYEPETPPHPPPKDPGYTPSSRSSGKTPLKTTPVRRDSGMSGRRVEFAAEGGAVQPIYSSNNGYTDSAPDRTHTNGNGVYTNGHYSSTTNDGRGRGER
jgi:hypothetical protein